MGFWFKLMGGLKRRFFGGEGPCARSSYVPGHALLSALSCTLGILLNILANFEQADLLFTHGHRHKGSLIQSENNFTSEFSVTAIGVQLTTFCLIRK